MKILRTLLVVQALFQYLCVSDGLETTSIGSVDDFEWDDNGRLSDHWLVYAEGGCASTVEAAWRDSMATNRRLGVLKEEMKHAYLKDTQCGAVVLDRGVEREFIFHPFTPMHRFVGYKALSDFIIENQRVEMGFLSYHPHNLQVYWQKKDDRGGVVFEKKVGLLEPGEPQTLWREAVLGHEFRFEDVVTGKTHMTFTAAYNSFNIVGRGGAPGTPPSDEEIRKDTAELLKDAVHNAHRIKRTFTEMGFAKGRLPKDLYGSIRAFYYNNRESTAHEDWSVGERNVNWWVAPSYMVVAPFKLKGKWQDTLKTMVEAWIGGVELDNTDIYGIREYKRGARLLSHVDREKTHAASLIVNVAQSGVDEDWPLEIYDHGGRLHEVVMAPGDILYYESARCIHGRMRPFQGESFVNIFSHYRPAGDPEWFLKENPPGTPAPIVNPSESDVALTKKDVPHLSRTKARIAIENEEDPNVAGFDLFSWWDYVGSADAASPLLYRGRVHDDFDFEL